VVPPRRRWGPDAHGGWASGRLPHHGESAREDAPGSAAAADGRIGARSAGCPLAVCLGRGHLRKWQTQLRVRDGALCGYFRAAAARDATAHPWVLPSGRREGQVGRGGGALRILCSLVYGTARACRRCTNCMQAGTGGALPIMREKAVPDRAPPTPPPPPRHRRHHGCRWRPRAPSDDGDAARHAAAWGTTGVRCPPTGRGK